MKNRERIIIYIDGQMSPEAKLRFEEELKNSSSLRMELENVYKLLNEFRDVKDIVIDEKYFTNLLPGSRLKAGAKKGFRFHPSIAYSFAAVLLVIFLTIIFRQDSNNETPAIENVISSLNEDEINDILDSYSDQSDSLGITVNNSAHFDSVMSQLIADELITANPDLNYIFENSENLSSIANEMTYTEADIVYNELINKKIF